VLLHTHTVNQTAFIVSYSILQPSR